MPDFLSVLGRTVKTSLARFRIHLCPPDVEGQQFQYRWESDRTKGMGNASQLGALVERTSRLLTLVHLPLP